MKDVQIASSLASIEAKVNSFRQEMESVNEHINYFKTQILELYEKPNVPAEFQEFKYKVDTFVQESSNRNDASKVLVDGIRFTIESIKNTLSQHGCDIRMLKDSMPIMEQQITIQNTSYHKRSYPLPLHLVIDLMIMQASKRTS